MKWDDVLRQACEVVGTVTMSKQDEKLGGSRWWATFIESDGQRVGGHEQDRMLPAYVAELLVAKVLSERGLAISRYRGAIPQHEWISAPARTRILAAMVALGHMTIEQAREVSNADG